MRRFPGNLLIAFFVLIGVFLPNKAIANLRDLSVRWIAYSMYAGDEVASPGTAIGGLQIDITTKLPLNSSDLSYSSGYLSANLQEKRLQVPISSIELKEAVELVQKHQDLVFQTSIDRNFITTLYGDKQPYASDGLRTTTFLQDLLVTADLEFAALVQAYLPMPPGSAIHPYEQALNLLNTDIAYKALPTRQALPPLSWPQIFMSFDSKAEGLVRLEFGSQVLFRSFSGYPLEVNPSYQTIGERPYLPLIKDVRQNSSLYRSSLPAVDRAASVTAVLGLVGSACRQPNSCQHLLIKSDIKEEREVNNLYSKLQLRVSQSQKKEPQGLRKLGNRWQELNLRDFQPGQNPEAWAAAYDALQNGMYNPSLTNQAIQLASKQFLNQPIPDDALLQAAAAVIYGKEGGVNNLKKAEQSLAKAMKLSKEYPVDSLEVANMGMFLSDLLNRQGIDKSWSESVRSNMAILKAIAIAKSYGQIDSYLTKCVKDPSACPSRELRVWEANTAKAQLGVYDSFIKSIDAAWLYGRFSYLVGLKEEKWRSDRLRLLSSYVRLAKTPSHKEELIKLESDLKARLKAQ